jgi:hypothetical protein
MKEFDNLVPDQRAILFESLPRKPNSNQCMNPEETTETISNPSAAQGVVSSNLLQPLTGLRLLIVDDEADTRDLLSFILVAGQCKVIDTTMKLHQAAKSGVVRGVNYSILLASN